MGHQDGSQRQDHTSDNRPFAYAQCPRARTGLCNVSSRRTRERSIVLTASQWDPEAPRENLQRQQRKASIEFRALLWLPPRPVCSNHDYRVPSAPTHDCRCCLARQPCQYLFMSRAEESDNEDCTTVGRWCCCLKSGFDSWMRDPRCSVGAFRSATDTTSAACFASIWVRREGLSFLKVLLLAWHSEDIDIER